MSEIENDIFKTPPDFRYSEPAAKTNFEEFCQVVTSRRSVRVYESRPVPEATVRRCLDLALLAPNSSNLQPWEFYWVRSAEKKARLVEACLSQPAAATAPVLIACVARTRTWRANAKQMLKAFADIEKSTGQKTPRSALAYYRKLVPLAYGQGPLGLLGLFKKVFIKLAGLFKPIPREPTSQRDLQVWAVKSTALACENLMLAFRAAGYDSCPMEGMDSTRVKKLLKLPSDAVVVMVVSAGSRAANGVYGPQIRFPSSQFLHEI